MQDGRLYASAGSPARDAAAGLAWLWRLGPLLDEPDPDAVGFGGAGEAAELAGLVGARKLAGAAIFAPEPGPANDPLPARHVTSGVATFANGVRLDGEFTTIDAGAASPARSSLGAHAAMPTGNLLVLGADPATAWTLVRGYWTLPVLAQFLAQTLQRPLVLLPPVGCVRLDDIPGTAQQQAQGDQHSDRRQLRRIEALRRAYDRAGATLNVAVAARALDSGLETELPLEQVWPRSVAALGDAVGAGVFAPVGHGYLHLDTGAFARGRIEPREFAHLGEAEAGRRLDAVLAWQEDVLGRRPRTFVAPAWGYSDGTLAAVAARGLHAWQRPAPGPLRRESGLTETIDSALRGLRGVDYGAFAAMAAAGLPPTPVLHGGLFDLRLQQLRASRDAVNLARLFLRRDAIRLAGLRGVRWIDADSLLDLIQAHEQVRVAGAEVKLGEALHAYLLEPGARTARPAGS